MFWRRLKKAIAINAKFADMNGKNNMRAEYHYCLFRHSRCENKITIYVTPLDVIVICGGNLSKCKLKQKDED